MTKPKMIIFDAGRTLFDYQSVDTLRGVHALMPYITSNPRNLTAEEIDRYTNEVFDHFEASRKQLYEVPEQTVLALVYDLLGLKFSISLKDVERIIWNTDSEIIPMPNAREVLDRLNELEIQTAVISNLIFSGNLLQDRLNSLFPNNQFRFVIASSDYGVRKPNRYIFEAGIAKSSLKPEEIWYVGDKISVDTEGSRNVGMVPVLYKCPSNHYPDIPDDLMVIEDLLDLTKLF